MVYRAADADRDVLTSATVTVAWVIFANKPFYPLYVWYLVGHGVLASCATIIAAPFMAAGLVLPVNIAPLSMTVGLLILLVGAVQYHVTQGRRAQFMARFLAPQVAAMVGARGLKSRAFEMAKLIRRRGIEVTERSSDAELQLGVGVGVASGYVTVGVIGAASRLEYTAVGPAVNLAARLCSDFGSICPPRDTTSPCPTAARH